jgi:hypothetical protein
MASAQDRMICRIPEPYRHARPGTGHCNGPFAPIVLLGAIAIAEIPRRGSVPNGGSARGYLGVGGGISAVPVWPIGWSPVLYIYTSPSLGRMSASAAYRAPGSADAVVSMAGSRIDEQHLGQWTVQASREPAVPDPPEADPEAHHRYITLGDWEGQGERSPSRRSGAGFRCQNVG